MKNVVLAESKKRRYLKTVITVWVVFCILFIAMLSTFIAIGKNNLNGSLLKVTGTVTKAEKDSVTTVTLNDGKKYNIVCDNNNTIDWPKYIGKEITFEVPLSTFASNAWVLGIEVDNETLFDSAATIAEKKEANKQMVLVAAILVGVSILVICALALWRANVAPIEERVLYHEYCEYLAARQPSCREYKLLSIIIIVWLSLFAILALLAALLGGDGETFAEITAAGKAFLFACLAVFVLGIVFTPLYYRLVILRRERQYYADNFPFDFSDLSQVIMRKALKTQLQEELKKERELHPHLYGDGGNGFDVTFDESGVTLSYPAEESAHTENTADIHDVFSEMPKENNEVFDGFGAPDLSQKLRLTYDKLNFEAVAHYRKNRSPMMIIIKSRIASREDLPEEFENDLHIAFDINLYKTLQAFNVPVENLQYLLDNKSKLIAQNCGRKANKGKSNIG